ncbi:MAG: hypothetical protein HFH38_00630 [Lachnospiraceae bacterium]|nr:hypothetical protein [Lachnospiraceae bacterium]
MALSVFLKFAGGILCGLLLCSGLLADFFRLHRENKRLEQRISQQKSKMEQEERRRGSSSGDEMPLG